MKANVTFLIIFMVGIKTIAQTLTFGERPGYVASIEGERESKYIELAPLPPLPPLPQVPLSDIIFTTQLKKEFQDRYREKFGSTEAEQIHNLPNPFTYEEGPDGMFRGTVIEESEEKNEFGAYMIRRLAEFHFDNFARNEPTVRPVWELKERIRQVQVEVSPGYKISAAYSFSGNYIESKFNNPIFDSKIILLMDPKETPSTSVVERFFSISKDINSSVIIEINYRDLVDRFSLIGRKRLAPTLEINVTLSSGFISEEMRTLTNTSIYSVSKEILNTREQQILIGFIWW